MLMLPRVYPNTKPILVLKICISALVALTKALS